MKKLLFCFIVLYFLGTTSTSYAGIYRSTDKFDNSTRIASATANLFPFSNTRIVKIILDDINKYSIIVDKTLDDRKIIESNNYADDYAEIKIDDDIYKMKILSAYVSKYSILYSEAELTDELVNKINIAKKVTIRFHKKDSTNDTLNLPDTVLNEWKQVINTKK